MSFILKNTKLADWRQSKKLSSHALASKLQEKMMVDYPDGFPRGKKITQTDIIHAEKHISPVRYEKVTNAIYRYLDVPNGFFGDYDNPLKKYEETNESLLVLENTVEYQTRNILTLENLVRTQSELITHLKSEIEKLRELLAKKK